MKIVVLSDTHIRGKEVLLPSLLSQELTTAELIIHAGDWQSVSVYDVLQRYGDVAGVYGNTDGEDMKDILPGKQIIEAEGWKIGVTHGHGDKKTTEQRAAEAFAEPLDLIIFGHSHIPLLRHVGKTMLFNPGSPTDKRKMPYYSFGILHVGKELRAEHVYFSGDE